MQILCLVCVENVSANQADYEVLLKDGAWVESNRDKFVLFVAGKLLKGNYKTRALALKALPFSHFAYLCVQVGHGLKTNPR